MLMSNTKQKKEEMNNKELIYQTNSLSTQFKIDYRSAKGISQLKMRGKIKEEDITKYLNPEFYTMKNVLELAKEHDTRKIIPTSFFENKEFLQKSGISRIPSNFAEGNQNLYQFTIQEEITEIGERAFFGCGNLKSINAVQRNEKLLIANKAFYDCIRLKEVILNCDVTLKNKVFVNCLSMHNIQANITEIGDAAFDGCVMLSSIQLPKIKEIGKKAFHDCVRLREFLAPNLNKISEYAFQNCYSMENVAFHKVKEIKEGAFSNSGLVTIYLTGIESIGKEAFQNCEDLKKIDITSDNVEMDNTIFDGCESLNTVVVNNKEFNTSKKEIMYIVSQSLS